MAGAARPVPGRVGVIVVAAGQSRRMEGIDKLFALLLGRPLLSHLLDGLCASPLVDEIVLVLGQETMDAGKALAQKARRGDDIRFCVGGERRQDSVRRGLDALSPCEWVAVHDGARPLAGQELLAKGLETARETGAAVPVIPLSDTVKMVDSEGWVVETLARDRLWAVQTPQVFRRELLAEAHRAVSDTVTDDAAMVERLGHRVRVFPGTPANLKVTRREDLLLAEALLGAGGDGD
ncbi:MAG: 2-C-methyl-D-erythritol 4-phosphate cytidylyltransferase [Chloroflexota bacterium]|nr:2-C-methyl-D-erythritol 4-phosphate cytidylyltransferase [Chloroflexota bacterium]